MTLLAAAFLPRLYMFMHSEIIHVSKHPDTVQVLMPETLISDNQKLEGLEIAGL